MTILGKSKDQIEVRLEKLPINEANPTYFDEYAPLDQRDTLTDTVTRYIVPEDQTYAIKILFKKGFVLGKFDGGFSVLIKEKATGTQIYARQFAFGDESYSTDSDTIYRVTAIPSAVVDGVVKQHVQLAFHHLSPDEELSGRTDVICCDASQVGGIEVEVRRNSKRKIRRKAADMWQKEVQDHKNQLAAGFDSLLKAAKIDHKIFNKQGITHGAILTGGETGGTLEVPHRDYAVATHIEPSHYHFICRTAGFLEDENIVKTPIPFESRPWDYFKERERADVFKDLQAYDKEQTLKQKIAGAGPDADAKAIQRVLFETGDVVNRWRGFGQTYKRERKALFKELQCRRTCFKKGEYPPDERLPGNSSNTVLSLDDHDHVPKETISVKEEASFTSSTTIKAEPEEDRPRLENGKAKPEVIALDDSDDDSVPPVGKLVVQKLPTKSQTTIKNEPEEPSSIPHNIPATRGQSKEERPAKRVKLESDVALPSIETDSELLRLKEEDELEEEELAVAQRVAQLIRKRNERKAKIAALENRSSVTPAPGHPSLS
ncbi:uncharacterized protein PAC_08914 [Phialocephala subalpina]|uniref:DUF7918 domain-containing protein n=1 Tax=Phialocephala subalpina TaxID=576137 RepID=A0A1L7X1Y9_9HELO|nr:uncharacterized protein PAC_08914 [Phialocephala subalpina]